MLLLTLSGYLEPDADPEILRAAPVLLVLGFGILLMVVPFHGQLVAIAAHTAPMVPTFVLSVFPPVVFHILLTLGESQPALFHDRLFFSVCRWLGTAAVAIGGVAAAGQRRWGHLVGYAALVDWGAGLVALGQGTEHGVALAVQMLGWRTASLLLTGTGLTIVFKALGQKDELSACGGMLQRRTTGVLALVGGLFSLAGFPLTPGAVGRWTLIDSLLTIDPRTAWILILAGAGVCVGALNGLRACLGPVPQDAAEKRFDGVVAIVFSFLGVWLAGASLLYPAPWLGLVERIASSFSFPPV
jgi:formate hydrogenlyase subunit 3/multisubunit Na+/H+ antiporter MnhD subunit